MITIATHAASRSSSTSEISAAEISSLSASGSSSLPTVVIGVPRPRQVAVQRIGRRGHAEHHHRDQVAVADVAEQRNHEHGDQHDPAQRKPVWKRHRTSLTPEQLDLAPHEAARQVVVDNAAGLHRRVHRGRADEGETAPLQLPGERLRPVGRWPAARRPVAGAAARGRADTTTPARPGTRRPPASPRAARALVIAAATLSRLRTIPASAISRATSASSKRAPRARSRTRRTPRRKCSRLRRIVSHESPDWNASSVSRS